MNNFGDVYKRLNNEQKRAVDTIDGPLLVLAGPGTGKTQLLSARVANILKTTDTNPQSILCLTFTEAAALNMRERLISMIGDAAYDVHINTYHSFASDIITSYPEYFEVINLETGEDSRMEHPIDELRQLEIIKDIIDKLPYTDPLRSAKYYIKSVLSTISDIKQAALTPDDIAALANQNLEVHTTLSAPIHDILSAHKRMPSKLAQAQPLFAEILQMLEKSRASLAELASAELTVALENAEGTNSTKPLTAWKNNWLMKDDEDNWTFLNEQHLLKLVSLAHIYAAYQKQLTQAGQYDFNDMIMQTIVTLKDRQELRYNLQEKYQYILLDEFQDTNVAQFELVRLLSDHPVHEGRPNIMAVGDDDQGIFAFQGADIGNMVSFLATYRDVEIINLTKNYRSHHDVLHVAHEVAKQIESRLHHSLQGISKEIDAAADSLPASATIARHEFVGQANEYGWIADSIADLIHTQHVPAHEIAVLAPKHRILEELVPFLNNQGISVTYEKRENIFQTPLIQGLLLVADFIQAASKNDCGRMDETLPKVLSLDYWNIPTKVIWNINWQHHTDSFESVSSWSRLALQQPETTQPTEFLLHLGSVADTTALEYMLDYMTGAQPLTLDDGTTYTSPLKSYYFSTKSQESNPLAFYEAISHLSVIRSHLRDQQKQDEAQFTLADFIKLYETYEEAQQPLLNTHPIAQNKSSVQLQTVYKAKGLEYEYVFLPSMQDDVWGSTASGGSNKLSLPPNLQYIRHDASTEDTRRRILFVAITRAKHGLFMTSYAQKENGKQTLPTKYMLESDTESGRVSSVLPASNQLVQSTERSTTIAQQDIDTYWHSRHTSITPDLQSLLSDHLKRYVMSPTHLNTFTNVEYAGPQSFFLHTLLRFPEAPTGDSMYGDALHKTLEWFQTQSSKKTIQQCIDFFTAKITHTYMDSASKDDYIVRGCKALTSYLTQEYDHLRQPAEIEADFRKESVILDDARLTGKIDRLEVDKEHKTVKIIDFKSGKPSIKWSSQSKYIAYKQQLYFYTLLIEKSNTYKGYTVESARLEFIEPLTNGNVAPPLVLPFDEAEYATFKQLVVSVWNHIQTLNLPDISNYTENATGMRQFIQSLTANDNS